MHNSLCRGINKSEHFHGCLTTASPPSVMISVHWATASPLFSFSVHSFLWADQTIYSLLNNLVRKDTFCLHTYILEDQNLLPKLLQIGEKRLKMTKPVCDLASPNPTMTWPWHHLTRDFDATWSDHGITWSWHDLTKTSSKPSKMRFESCITSTRKTENLAHLTYLHAESGMRNKSKLGHL